MAGDDLERECAGGAGRQGAQLQREAFLGTAGTDAHGLEVLHVAQRDGQVVEIDFGFRRQQLEQVVEWLVQVAVIVERLDQEAHQGAVAIGHLRQGHLLVEIFTQRNARGLQVLVVDVIVVALAAARGAGADVGPVDAVVCAAALAAFALVAVGGGCFGRAFLRLLAFGRGGGGCLWCEVRAVAVLALEHRVLEQDALDLLVQLDRRQLQQLDRLLQLRRQREVLGELELEAGFHRGGAEGGLTGGSARRDTPGARARSR